MEQVWFRGAHCDVAGGNHACAPLSGIALDWVLDGAARAGAAVCPPPQRPSPDVVDALAGSAHPVSFRRVPAGAAVHASVEFFVRAHPSYWRRLPEHVVWTDPDWVARGERLVSDQATPRDPAAPAPALTATGVS